MGTTSPPPLEQPTRARFGVLGFICSLSLLTYLDRVCIMRAQEDIQNDLGFDKAGMGLVFSAFILGYALCEVPGGWMGDVWGSRRVLTRIVLCWSLFTALTGCVWSFALDSGYYLPLGRWHLSLVFNSLGLMLLIRFLFGVGEAGAYPNLARVVGTWFPFRERGQMQGMIWFSARIGGALAPAALGWLTIMLGWRRAFWVLGALGAAWCATFALWFRDTPEQMPACNAAERDLIRSGKPPDTRHAGRGHGWPPLRALVGSVTLWGMCAASCFVCFGWYFYPTWQPQYLKDVFGITFKNSEILTGLPFLCGAVGSLFGGGLSDYLVHRTGSRRWGRSLIGVVGFSLAGLCVLATGFVSAWWQAVALLCLAFFVNDLAIPVIWAACADVGGRFAGTVSGIMNMAGGIGAILSPALIPRVLDWLPKDYSAPQRWRIIFAGLAVSWFLGALAWLFIDAGKPLFSKEVRSP